jgi:hypothetical protein
VTRTLIGAVMGFLLLAEPAAAQQARCLRDALGELYCARDPQGFAVLDNLGVVRCAPGSCVDVNGVWVCATQPGGTARLDPEGPVCSGGCGNPNTTDCEHQ